MKFWKIEPEVAGHIGGDSVIDRSSHPPVVTSLHFVFDGWMGDELVTSFPCFLISLRLSEMLDTAGFSGYRIESCRVSTSDEYEEMAVVEPPLPALPRFVWLKVFGKDRSADLWLCDGRRLVVSEKVMEVIRPFVKYAECTLLVSGR